MNCLRKTYLVDPSSCVVMATPSVYDECSFPLIIVHTGQTYHKRWSAETAQLDEHQHDSQEKKTQEPDAIFVFVTAVHLCGLLPTHYSYVMQN